MLNVNRGGGGEGVTVLTKGTQKKLLCTELKWDAMGGERRDVVISLHLSVRAHPELHETG